MSASRSVGAVLSPGAAEGEWTYWQPAAGGIVELGTLRGCRVGLPVHHHREDQLTFVLTGRRRFLVGDRLVTLGAGQGTLIRAGAPHRSFAEPGRVVCLDAYLPAGDHAAGAVTRDLARLWARTGRVGWAEVAAIVREHRRGQAVGTASAEGWGAAAGHPAPCHGEAVRQAAARAGMSREASRAGSPGGTARRRTPSGSWVG